MKKCICLLMALMLAILTGCTAEDVSSLDPEKYIQLGEYKGLTAERINHEVTREEIDEEINLLLQSAAEFKDVVDRAVREGDTVNIDYEGKLDGVTFDGGTAQGYDLEIGSDSFIDGFEDGLIGVNLGDTVDLNLTFPTEYHSAELAGKDVVFTVTVNGIKEKELPEFTDDLINELSGGQYTKTADYIEALKQQIALEYTEKADLEMYNTLWQTAVDNATLLKDLPSDYVQGKVSTTLLNAQKMAKEYGMSQDDFIKQYMGLSADEFTAQAAEFGERAAKESLVLLAIAKKEGLELTEEEIEKGVQEYVELYGYSSVEDFKKDNDMEQFKEYILKSKVQDFLADNAVITTK